MKLANGEKVHFTNSMTYSTQLNLCLTKAMKYPKMFISYALNCLSKPYLKKFQARYDIREEKESLENERRNSGK